MLILDEIGKDISGAGMDPNITGRSGHLGTWKPFLDKIVVRDISEKSHHSGAGLGNADVTTMRAFNNYDMDATYPNGITATDTESMKIPPVMPNDRCAFKYAIRTVLCSCPKEGPRIVWMHNTLGVDHFYISETLIPEVEKIEGLTLAGEARPVPFDADGNFIGW